MNTLALSRDEPLLTIQERARLQVLEGVVERGLGAFLEVAAALLEIRDSRLYRETHSTFEDFVRDRFQLARSTAYGLMDASRVAANVSPEGHGLSLSHLRALAPLEPTTQRELAPVVSEVTVAEARRVIREWRATQRREWAEKPTPPPPVGTFRTIVADPPLAYKADYGDGLAADKYKTMSLEELAALPVADLAAPDSHLYVWIGATRIPACSAE